MLWHRSELTGPIQCHTRNHDSLPLSVVLYIPATGSLGITMRKLFPYYAALAILVVLVGAYFFPWFIYALVIVVPLILVGTYDMFQTKHAVRRTFPLVGRGRWFMEWLRPFFRQYFFESETDGAPVNRMFRGIIYQRAKGDLDTTPYGTKIDTARIGYEWMGHSIAAHHLHESETSPRITIGGSDCKQPYDASVLNISAMSFGALSHNAIRSLNRGAKLGGFSHNTGEGGLSPYHLENGGDIVWQIGTGYFGCRDKNGNFNPEKFAERAAQDAVKMIEIKMSQGAKPGHGGILPASKNTPEIAKIRDVEPHTTVDSPPEHKAFSTPREMMHFIHTLRELSKGKPIGFKLAVGRTSEIFALCKAMVETGIKPDFITVDGGEGGTGAAPLEYTNSVGMPLRDALALLVDALMGFDLKKEIKVIASGKVFTGFHAVKNLALGADACNSARGMMIALGCIQSLECNTNHCPTGVATQREDLAAGIVVTDKAQRVARFHKETVKSVAELCGSAGLNHPAELNRSHIYRRISQTAIARYDQIFPYIKTGCFLGDDIPHRYALEYAESSADTFKPVTSMSEYGADVVPMTV